MPSDTDLKAEHKADVKAFAKAIGGDRWKTMESTALDEMVPAAGGAAEPTDKPSSSKASHVPATGTPGALIDLASDWFSRNVSLQMRYSFLFLVYLFH